ncbi:MAG: hypothetical protein JSV88_32070 [Candidatus Aminicenantes bacterium]|nr:MAG: hypothetical protein JSV88_32070 [Candidatus Aminicenantes bacterium]
MKKTILLPISLLILFLSFTFIAVAQEAQSPAESPMASFMDARWGTTADYFETNFKYKGQLKKDSEFFYLTDFPLADMVIKKIKFKFEGSGGRDVKFIKRNYSSLFLTEVIMFTKSEDFETLLQIFKTKYGEPKKYDEFEVRDSAGKAFLQKVARWEDETIKRLIIMERQASKLVDGMVMFIPIKPKAKVEKKDKIKEAAEKI